MLYVLTSCVAGYITLQSSEFRAKHDEGFFGAVIDVRTQGEWDAGHLPNATFIESLQVNQDTSRIAACTSCRIAVYCRTGQRSKAAADVLEAAGFTDVYGGRRMRASGRQHTLT